MIKKIITSTFASVILLSQVANAEIKLGDKGSIGTIAFNAGYNSAYVWRGMDQNNGSGSPYIGADLSTPIGFYLGVWTASAQPSGTGGNNDQELDIYGGIAKTFGPLTFDIGVIEYRYPGADRQGSTTTASNPVNFLEYYGKLKFAPDKAPYSIQLAYYEDDTDGQSSGTNKNKGKNYQEISGAYNFPILTVAASYGEYKGETETITLTLSKSLFDMNFAATFVDAKKLKNSIAATSFNTSKDFFLNVSKTF